jgi:hypothetical protein
MSSVGGDFYGTEIDNSLRFNDNDSAYLQRTAGTPTNNKIWTLSCWVKLANLSTARTIFNGFSSTSAFDQIIFNSSDKFFMQFNNSGTYGQFTSNQVFRDVSSWGHLVVKADTTAGSNGVTAYWNGDVISGTWNVTLASNANFASINASGDAQRLGLLDTGVAAQYFDGYLADVYFIDGTALDATSFGETKSGIWIPKAYSGSYGTNGFHLDFGNSAALGTDVSGNGNNFTANNLSSHDQMPDSPTNNFPTINILTTPAVSTGNTYSEGNLKLSFSTAAGIFPTVLGTQGITSGKWYWEVRYDHNSQNAGFGVFNDNTSLTTDYGATQSGLTDAAFAKVGGADRIQAAYLNTLTEIVPATITDPVYISVLFDADNGKMYILYNGTEPSGQSIASGTSLFGSFSTGKNYLPCFYHGDGGSGTKTGVFWVNFGQDSTFAGTATAGGNTDENGIGDFYYTVPSGYLALCSANMPAPAIDPANDDTPADYFDTVLYTAASSNGTYNIGNASFVPDFTWIKNRDNVEEHYLFDVVRGNSSITNKFLNTNSTDAEGAGGVSGTTVTSQLGGMQVVESSINTGELYFNSRTYAMWNWKAGGTGVSNTDGSITSTVSANQDAGFSIVTYTGNATAGATVGHGLGKKPTMIIVKNRDDGAQDWPVQHGSIGATGQMVLSSTAANNANIVYWNNTEPTSSVFSLGTANNTNQSGDSHVAYCFTDIDGFSKAGSYIGNGSSDGPFIYTGFRPSWVMIKNTNSTGGSGQHWQIADNKRDTYNLVDTNLLAENVAAEGHTWSAKDFLSNGFKIRGNNYALNYSGDTYIYLAFAEQPFKYANAR